MLELRSYIKKNNIDVLKYSSLNPRKLYKIIFKNNKEYLCV